VQRVRTTSAIEAADYVSEYLNKFNHNRDVYLSIAEKFSTQMNNWKATDKDKHFHPSPTLVKKICVDTIPDGQNSCLYVDFGGTFFRLGIATVDRLPDNTTLHIESKIMPIPKHISAVEDLFKFIGKNVERFSEGRFMTRIPDGEVPVAFVCSFPFDIGSSINSAVIRRFTKQIDITENLHIDAGAYLQKELDKLTTRFNFKVSCVLNDTTSTLLSFANSHFYIEQSASLENLAENCQIGLICGLGCNTAFFRQKTGSNFMHGMGRLW